MKIKIQFDSRNPLPEQEGIMRIDDFSHGTTSPDSFKWECDLEWARGKHIPVKQVLIFSDGTFIGRMSSGDTLGNFVKKWENKF